jgi:radical SAM superfamily enzyme YgiQ (UPF0313 family)
MGTPAHQPLEIVAKGFMIAQNLDILLVADEDYAEDSLSSHSRLALSKIHAGLFRLARWVDLMPLWLGVVLLATYAAQAGFETAVINNVLASPFSRMRFLRLLRRAPRAVGISTVAITYPETVAEIVSIIRRQSPNSIIILGGRGAGRSAAMRKHADITIIDYGENALIRLLSGLKKGLDIDSIPGVEMDEDGTRIMRGDAYYETGGKTLFPDWRFSNSLVKMFSVEGSRGCKHNCSFCTVPNKKKQVFRTPSDVFNEVVNDVRVHRAKEISFVDSSFTSDSEFITEFLGLLLSAKLGISWICLSRVDDFVRQSGLAEQMVAAGCRLIYLGIESIHDDILVRMRKGYNRKTVEEAISRLDGLNVLAYFIVGFPGDTEAKVRETVDFIERSPLSQVSIRPLYVSPELFGQARLYPDMFCHLRGEAADAWEHDTMNYARAVELAKWTRRCLNRHRLLPMAF